MPAVRICAFALASLSALGCLPSSAAAAEMPALFRGVWSIDRDDVKQCRKSDWDKHDFDGMISVGANEVQYWESSCKVQSARKSADTTFELGLACGGEGMRWQSREVWHVEKVGGRRQLIAVTLERSDERDEQGKRIKGSGDRKVYVSVHLECQ